MTEGIAQPNQGKIRMLGEKETYKYLGILEVDTIKHMEMKEKIQKEYLRRTRKFLETKQHSRKSHQSDKHQGYLSRKILRTILKVGEGKTSTNGLESRQLMTMHKALYPRDDIDRLNVS